MDRPGTSAWILLNNRTFRYDDAIGDRKGITQSNPTSVQSNSSQRRYRVCQYTKSNCSACSQLQCYHRADGGRIVSCGISIPRRLLWQASTTCASRVQSVTRYLDSRGGCTTIYSDIPQPSPGWHHCPNCRRPLLANNKSTCLSVGYERACYPTAMAMTFGKSLAHVTTEGFCVLLLA